MNFKSVFHVTLNNFAENQYYAETNTASFQGNFTELFKVNGVMRERCFVLINIGAVIAIVSCVLSCSHGTGVLLLAQ
jgi:hypothetical protein